MFLLLADLGRVLHHSDGMVTKTNTNPSFFVLNIPLIHPVALRGDMELTCPRLLHNAVLHNFTPWTVTLRAACKLRDGKCTEEPWEQSELWSPSKQFYYREDKSDYYAHIKLIP